MKQPEQSRRDFIKTTAMATAGVSLAMTSAASYARIIGANDRINLSVVGLRSRGMALLESALNAGGNTVHFHSICDVDSKVLAKKSAEITKLVGYTPAGMKDFRKVLDKSDVDAVMIATPDHTHAPFAIYALQADKHVYVEKPCSHNPREGELLTKAAQRYPKVVQMGNQQRSAPTSIEAVRDKDITCRIELPPRHRQVARTSRVRPSRQAFPNTYPARQSTLSSRQIVSVVTTNGSPASRLIFQRGSSSIRRRRCRLR